nr:exonuclease SbcC [Isoptericola halotolerans]
MRAVVHFAAGSAQQVLPLFEEVRPDDGRPREALAAARAFVDGAPRSRRQRLSATDAHRAAREAPTEVSRLAAQAAGDAPAAAYLHPIARAHQVGHVLRAAANAARIAEIQAGERPAAAEREIALACARAGGVVVDVLRRYPPAPPGRSRAARLLAELDGALRSSG